MAFLQWEKMKIGIYCYLTADFFKNALREIFQDLYSTKRTCFAVTS